MFNPNYNTIPYLNREVRRKVEKYRKKYPNLTFTQAYNKIFGTNYNEPKEIIEIIDTSTPQPKRKDDTSTENF